MLLSAKHGPGVLTFPWWYPSLGVSFRELIQTLLFRLHSFGGSAISGYRTWDIQSCLMTATGLLTCLSQPLLTAEEVQAGLLLISSCPFETDEIQREVTLLSQGRPMSTTLAWPSL